MIRLFVQQIHRKVEIRRKQRPCDIGQLQESGCLLPLIEANCHDNDEDHQHRDPNEREQTPFEHKEKHRPEQIDRQLPKIGGVDGGVGEAARAQYAVGYAHQQIEKAPRDGKQKRRRRKGYAETA